MSAERAREWSIADLSRAAGVTSRTLRHYDSTGLLTPARVGANGYRYYDEAALLRLQRILLLRSLGLGIAAISAMLRGEADPAEALSWHLSLLEEQQSRTERQIEAVRSTLISVQKGGKLMPDVMFDGFDSTEHEAEVTQRWGADSYARSQKWWTSLSAAEKQQFQQEHEHIAAAYGSAHQRSADCASEEVQNIARRHVEWLSHTTKPTAEYLLGLGEMYVADPRFAANYDAHSNGAAVLVRDALRVYAERNFAPE